ncbi:polyprenyl synthetase family protein [Prolixibacter sp. NT017]|uniref:polyprenyl synthetase family protein n=1 Tax=Prolixibacter sp. NT017 TaxID=2652390 RepID=UPI001271C898|nr:polyprenyl synthetase family protein [Prolixibacter sp. NT017]GET27060.1 isoprenyl synthetase [Prolixibacter sp. NT017]
MKSQQELFDRFLQELKKEREKIDNATPAGLYKPVSYTLDMGGKRLRPVLVLTGANLFSENIEEALPAATAIEVFHNFTLLHDDLMDNASVRRGKPTVHLKFNPNTAVLSGDAMMILANEYLANSPAEKLPELLKLFSRTALEVCEGQQYDMDFESRMDVTVDEYIEMIRLKTAVLIAGALKLGAIIGNAPEKQAKLLYDFGINIGLAFQLQDDWLDVYGDPNVFGKKIGGDILSNKKTFLLLKAQEKLQGEKKKQLQNWITKESFLSEEKIEAVTQLYNEAAVSEEAQQLMLHYHDEALKCLAQLEVEEDNKKDLVALAEQVMSRIS